MASPKSDRPGAVTWAGLAVVAGAASVLSFATVRDLADNAGYPPNLGWLLPVVIDATAVVGSRIWLGGTGHPGAVRYARTLALAAAAVTIGANVLEHGLAAYHAAPPWWLVAVLAAIPPTALVAVAHQVALLSRQKPGSATAAEGVTVAQDQRPESPTLDVDDRLTDTHDQAAETDSTTAAVDSPDSRVRELVALLEVGESVTGPQAAARFGCSARTGRRLVAAAQDLIADPNPGRSGDSWDRTDHLMLLDVARSS